MRIAFDLDGTLADMASALAAEAEKLFGHVSARLDVDDAASPQPSDNARESVTPVLSRLILTDPQRAKLWRRVEKIPDFWTTLAETEPGIVARIAAIAAERRWDVIFLTTRPLVAGATTQLQSQQWLDAHGFRWPSVFVVKRSRGRIADALGLDAVVDDRTENCIDVATQSKAHAILVHPGSDDAPFPGARQLGVRVVGSISDALALLQKLDDGKNGSGVTRRIRKLFSQ